MDQGGPLILAVDVHPPRLHVQRNNFRAVHKAQDGQLDGPAPRVILLWPGRGGGATTAHQTYQMKGKTINNGSRLGGTSQNRGKKQRKVLNCTSRHKDETKPHSRQTSIHSRMLDGCFIVWGPHLNPAAICNVRLPRRQGCVPICVLGLSPLLGMYYERG